VVIGNCHDMAEAAALFETVDAALTEIYAARSGRPESGMADSIAEGNNSRQRAEAEPRTMAQSRPDIQARRRIDAALAQQGIPRSTRRAILKDLTGTQNAGGKLSSLRQLIDTIRS